MSLSFRDSVREHSGTLVQASARRLAIKDIDAARRVVAELRKKLELT